MSQSASASKIPSRLEPGDKVAVVAPAGPVDPVRLDAGLEILAKRYTVEVDRDAVLSRDGYLAGSDERRASEINRALRDPTVRAIFMARGGYGLTRILHELDVDALIADPVPIVGFSDGTALLSWALTSAGVRGIHGPVVGQLASLPEADHEVLFNLLEAAESPGLIADGLDLVVAQEPKVTSGRLIAGNLCLLAHLVGTPYMPLAPGDVLLIEDVGERPYAIDRYLTHLGQSGSLDGVAAAIVGDFTACVESKMSDTPPVHDVIQERLSALGIGAVRLRGVGHGDGNRALPFGARVTVDTGSGRLSVDEPAVA